ncbi:integrase core domain-containing protein [Hirsutella rhossiliensis]
MRDYDTRRKEYKDETKLVTNARIAMQESVVSSKQNAFDEDLPIPGYMMNLTRTKYSTHLKRFNAKDLDSWIDKWEDIMSDADKYKLMEAQTGQWLRDYEQGSRILDAKSEATQGKLFDFDRYGPPAAAPVNPVVHNPAAAAQRPQSPPFLQPKLRRRVNGLIWPKAEKQKNPRCYQRGGAFHADKAAADADDADEVPPAKKKKLDREPLEREPYSKRDPCLACRRKGHELEGCWQVIEEARPKGYNPPPERYLKMTRERVADDPQPRMRGRLVGSANPAFVFSAESPGLKGSEYPLKNSTLLDCGASLHINNKLSRFRSFKKAKNDFIVAGFGRVNKVAYCPGFSSSLVSLQTLIDDDQIFWDTLSEPMRLVRKGQTIGITERKYQQFVVEYQPVETEFPDFNRKLEEPAQEILDLPLKETASFGTPVLVTLYCAQGKVRRQVSRRPPDEERDKPCYEIWIDWTDLARDHENYVRVMFITDAFSGMTYKAKEHGAVLKDFSSFMLARFGFKTNLFTKKISAWMRKKGMTKAMSASNTQDQLWKEIIEAACYLRNRTPREPRFAAENANEGEADWKEEKSALTSSCLGLRKRWKLDPRAHIGYPDLQIDKSNQIRAAAICPARLNILSGSEDIAGMERGVDIGVCGEANNRPDRYCPPILRTRAGWAPSFLIEVMKSSSCGLLGYRILLDREGSVLLPYAPLQQSSAELSHFGHRLQISPPVIWQTHPKIYFTIKRVR